MLLLAHRGARRYAAENTLPAFDLALHQGADGFEFDLRLTGDQKTIVCHDPKLNRLSIRRHTLKELQAGCAPVAVAPTLEDVLRRYARTAFLNIELKVKGLEHAIQGALRVSPPERGYFISSFLPGVVRELHALDASLKLGTISDSQWQLRRWESLPALYVVPNYRLLSRKLVEEVHTAGKLVCTWTLNEPKEMRRAAELGVDGIISDDPKLLRETLKDRG
ncbi:MAG TPA: glycerophosphodiester phosphodiesterase [Candidatus Saccharimonadales bacterium]|jgi:glycerophosphoryl diester phosphodiesterase|nr:glycerophosphodiester phosphodiesterase [Candidatus Saccharimonadales bacterium]